MGRGDRHSEAAGSNDDRTGDKIGDKPLAVVHRGDPLAHHVGHSSGAQDSSEGHRQSHYKRTSDTAEERGDEQECSDFRCVVQPSCEADRSCGKVVRTIEGSRRLDAKDVPLIATPTDHSVPQRHAELLGPL